MDDHFGDWSEHSGWSGEIFCTECGRTVMYAGHRCERKADVEKKLRELWHVANEALDNG